jgi:hypothetical protein
MPKDRPQLHLRASDGDELSEPEIEEFFMFQGWGDMQHTFPDGNKRLTLRDGCSCLLIFSTLWSQAACRRDFGSKLPESIIY